MNSLPTPKQHDSSGKQRSARTSGDGMEQEDLSTIEAKAENPSCSESENSQPVIKLDQKKLRLNVTVNPFCQHKLSSAGQSPLCGLSKGRLHYLIPRLVNPKKSSEINKTERKPRFIPFEPYKCAVKPIVPSKKPKRLKQNRNNLDINILVSQMSDMKTSELNAPTASRGAEAVESEMEQEREKFRKEIEELKKERDSIQGQLKFQVQVNSELKNLLVAAVGEDMQTKVHVLTEDKLQLARALLDTANNLSTHTEQIEFLAGQCEVWRSKFLASSVMVEELARWKADLTHKNTLLTKSSKRMLQLSAQIREMQLDILKHLKFLAKLKQLNLPSGDIVNLTSECLNISQQMVLHSGIGMPENLILGNLQTLTEAERDAIEALECVSQPLMATDEAFKAIVGQAFCSKTKVCSPIIEEGPEEGNKS